jgi:hypothetical protein
MNTELLKSHLNPFYTSMINNPWDIAWLLFLILLIFLFLRRVSGNSSRENWYKEKQLLARKKNQEIGRGGEIFLKSRKYSRWFYWSMTILLLVSLPFTYTHLLLGLDRYGPVLVEHWYILIAVYVLYRVLLILNAMMNLKLLAKELEENRSDK